MDFAAGIAPSTQESTPKLHINTQPGSTSDTTRSDIAHQPQRRVPSATATETPASSSPMSQPSSPPANTSGGRKIGAEHGATLSPIPVIDKSANGRKKLPARGSGFGQAEVDHFLSLLDHYLPLCKDEWDIVIVEHSKIFPQNNRSVESLRRKFASLHRRKMPTGDPLMPADVRRAKHIRYKMTERADMGTMEGDDPDETMPCDDGLPSISTSAAQSGEEDVDDLIHDDESSPTSSTPSASNECDTNIPPTVLPTHPPPRPLVRKRHELRKKSEDEDDLMSLLKAQIVQDGIRREEERKQREVDRQMNREREAMESKRHERMMEMMMMMFCGGGKNISKDQP